MFRMLTVDLTKRATIASILEHPVRDLATKEIRLFNFLSLILAVFVLIVLDQTLSCSRRLEAVAEDTFIIHLLVLY